MPFDMTSSLKDSSEFIANKLTYRNSSKRTYGRQRLASASAGRKSVRMHLCRSTVAVRQISKGCCFAALSNHVDAGIDGNACSKIGVSGSTPSPMDDSLFHARRDPIDGVLGVYIQEACLCG